MTAHTLEYTGERHLPWSVDYQTSYEHVHRYLLACEYAEGKRVLDITCGEGYGSALLARVARSVIGVDIDATTVRHARKQHGGPNTHFVRADAQAFALAPGSIDLVVSFETIEHFMGHASFLANMRAVLAPDGILIISTPNRHIYTDAVETDLHNPFHQKELYREEFVDLLKEYFPQVQLLGQSLVTGSAVGTAHGETFLRDEQTSRLRFTAIDAGQTDYPLRQESALVPRYYLAVCGRAALPARPNSVMLDNNETLYHHFTEQVAALQTLNGIYRETEEQRGAALSAFEASEAAGARLNAALAETQTAFARAEAQLTETREVLAETQSTLADTRGESERTGAALSQARAGLAGAQNELTRTRDELAETQAALSEVMERLAETQRMANERVKVIEQRLARILRQRLPRAGARSAANGSAADLRALIMVPGGVNYFYDDTGLRVAEALESLGFVTAVTTLDALTEERYDLCIIVNVAEVIHGVGDEERAIGLLAKVHDVAPTCAAMTLDSVKTHWFSGNVYYCEKVRIRSIIDLGFHDQRALLPDHMGNVRYVFAFNGLTQSERQSLDRVPTTLGDRPVPWVMVGHQTAERARLAREMMDDYDTAGVVYLPYLTAFTAQGPHLTGPQLDTLLSHARYQIWCSHHTNFYLESERFRASLLTGGVPVKALLYPLEAQQDAPFSYLLVDADALIDYLQHLDFAATRQRFRDDFVALPTLDEGLLQALVSLTDG